MSGGVILDQSSNNSHLTTTANTTITDNTTSSSLIHIVGVKNERSMVSTAPRAQVTLMKVITVSVYPALPEPVGAGIFGGSQCCFFTLL